MATGKGKVSRTHIGAAIRHLTQYVGSSELWSRREDELLDTLFAPVADALGRDADSVTEELLDGDHGEMALAFAFEENATAYWSNEDKNLVEVYLGARGWREKPGGRRYLQALAASELERWEVVAVEPGRSIDLRPYAGGETVRVQERSGSEAVRVYDVLAVRVIVVGGERMIAGAVLTQSPEGARRTERALDAVSGELREAFETLKADGEIDALPPDLDRLVAEERQSRLAEVAFAEWALAILGVDAMVPELANTDGHEMVPTRTRLPVAMGQEEITEALSGEPTLSRSEDDGAWTWLAPPSGDADPRTVLGTLTLRERHLELETNSAERARRGTAMLRDVLGAGLGAGLAVHETLPSAIDGAIQMEDLAPDPSGDGTVTAIDPAAAASRYLDAHYRRTLDEPIPTLDGRTPRECAADPAGQADVVVWLKTLENAAAHWQAGSAATYSFAWLWTELGLADRR